MDRVLAYFRGLREVLAADEVRMSGAWSGKKQLQYRSPDQHGTGDGPFVEAVKWQWEGAFESAEPLVGMALLVLDDGFYWAKSTPSATRPAVSVSAGAWRDDSRSVSFTGSFYGAYLPSAPADADAEPPASCIMGATAVTPGTPHLVAQLGHVAFAVVLVPASAVKVGRNRLWRLRAEHAATLSPELQRLMTNRRSGKVAWSSDGSA